MSYCCCYEKKKKKTVTEEANTHHWGKVVSRVYFAVYSRLIITYTLLLSLSLTIWQRHPKKKAEKEEKGEGQGEPHQVHMQQFIKEELKAVQERKRKTHERKHPHCFFFVIVFVASMVF